MSIKTVILSAAICLGGALTLLGDDDVLVPLALPGKPNPIAYVCPPVAEIVQKIQKYLLKYPSGSFSSNNYYEWMKHVEELYGELKDYNEKQLKTACDISWDTHDELQNKIADLISEVVRMKRNRSWRGRLSHAIRCIRDLPAAVGVAYEVIIKGKPIFPG